MTVFVTHVFCFILGIHFLESWFRKKLLAQQFGVEALLKSGKYQKLMSDLRDNEALVLWQGITKKVSAFISYLSDSQVKVHWPYISRGGT